MLFVGCKREDICSSGLKVARNFLAIFSRNMLDRTALGIWTGETAHKPVAAKNRLDHFSGDIASASFGRIKLITTFR